METGSQGWLSSGKDRRTYMLLLVAAFAAVYVIWGSTYLAIRVGVETLPPFLMAATRFLVAGSVLYIWARARGTSAPRGSDWRAGLITGALLLLVGNGLVVWSEQFVESSVAALLIATEPFWIVILIWLLPGGNRPRFKTLIGLTIGFIGVGMLVGTGTTGGNIPPLHAGALLVASLSWAAGSVYASRTQATASPLLAAAIQMLTGGSLLVIASGVSGEWTRFAIGNISSRSLLALGYLVVFGSIVAFTAYSWLLKNVAPERASTYAYVNPVVAVLLGWAVAGEQVTRRSLVAAAIIVGAVVLTIRGKKLQDKVKGQGAIGANRQGGETDKYTTDFVTQTCSK